MPIAVGAIDQGTTSTRCMLFGPDAQVLAVAQREHRQSFPQPGWVEHDPLEIWANTQIVVTEALRRAGLQTNDLSAVGITNQRETVVVWDRHTGRPVCPAIVWQDTRTAASLSETRTSHGPHLRQPHGRRVMWLLI